MRDAASSGSPRRRRSRCRCPRSLASWTDTHVAFAVRQLPPPLAARPGGGVVNPARRRVTSDAGLSSRYRTPRRHRPCLRFSSASQLVEGIGVSSPLARDCTPARPAVRKDDPPVRAGRLGCRPGCRFRVAEWSHQVLDSCFLGFSMSHPSRTRRTASGGGLLGPRVRRSGGREAGRGDLGQCTERPDPRPRGY